MRRQARAVAVLAMVGSTAALAAPRDQPSSKLRLPDTLEQSVQAHETLARRAKGSPERLCRLVDESYDLAHPLYLALSEASAGVSAEKEQQLWDELDRRVTGVYFAASEVFYRSGVDYWQLAGLAGADDAPLLRAMAELDGVSRGGIENVPAWQEALTDESGCHTPARATKPLTALTAGWAAARPCMRVALTKPLDELLGQMASDENFCQGDRAERIRAVRENAAQMRKLTGTRGPALADALVKRAIRSGNRRPRIPG